MRLVDWIKKVTFGKVGAIKTGEAKDDREILVGDKEKALRVEVKAYNEWYTGDSDELGNFYTSEGIMQYNIEPFYGRNKRSYFWYISSSESDVKKTHSGLPRAIVDTLSNIVGFPVIKCNKEWQEILDKIMDDNNLEKIVTKEQVPLTYVEGWGAFKITWDMEISQYPIVVYYKANEVDYIKKAGRVIGLIYKDYYNDGRKRYLITETRVVKNKDLHIDKAIFEVTATEELKELKFEDVEVFKNTVTHHELKGVNCLLGGASVFYEDTNRDLYGRSIYKGKLDLFDDLDQALSQASNSVRRSTPQEYINTDYLERDMKTGLPRMPKVYDRKYVGYKGGVNSDGSIGGGTPVMVTQPNIDFSKYSNEAISIVVMILQGIMSPATLGIDVAKKDNAEAQREKEKVTIFTRKDTIKAETRVLKSLITQLLIAYQIIENQDDETPVKTIDFGVSIKFDEFADDSFENKVKVLGDAYASDVISDKMYVQKLYGDSLSDEDLEYELNYIKSHHPDATASEEEELLNDL